MNSEALDMHSKTHKVKIVIRVFARQTKKHTRKSKNIQFAPHIEVYPCIRGKKFATLMRKWADDLRNDCYILLHKCISKHTSIFAQRKIKQMHAYSNLAFSSH
jgi:hypothetical protein